MMVIEKGCASCKEWQEHYYWGHMDVSKIHFFKLMTEDFAKSISIPEKFAKNFKGKITKGVDLKAPSSETWHIGIDKHGDEMLLTSGWEDFVRAHELQENDLLLFSCSGSTSFEVLIFESSGCEKLSTVFGSNFVCKNFKTTIGRHAEHYSLSVSGNNSMPSRLIGSHHNVFTLKKSSGREADSPNSSKYHVKREATEEEESDNVYADSKYYYSRFANRLTDEEKETILNLVGVGPDNPAFVTILKKNHLQRRSNSLTVPSGFAADHLVARLHDIILRRPNRKEKWLVKYYYTPYHRCFQNLQFYSFVRENKLREGDICVFELMKGTTKVAMTVHVIRKVDRQFVLVG